MKLVKEKKLLSEMRTATFEILKRILNKLRSFVLKAN